MSDSSNDTFNDDAYVSGKQDTIPVQSDDAGIEDGIDVKTADSDEQLERDDNEAIDKNNVLKGGRTRGAKPSGSYQEPGDEEGLPGPDDGRSAIAQ